LNFTGADIDFPKFGFKTGYGTSRGTIGSGFKQGRWMLL
jgi:hypothetical protein